MFNPGAETAGPGGHDRQLCLRLSVFNASQDSSTPSSGTSRAPSQRLSGSLGGLRVLVVEDDPDARELVTAILEDAGAVVASAPSAAMGFDAVRSFHPHLLVSDIGMPDEDGYSLIRRVRALADDEGGYSKDLFFVEIEGNERILNEFSVLIEQQVMNEDYYFFWKEMQDLNQPDGVFATPPFNLKSNLTASKGKVYGYFGVVREQAVRWYFNRTDLSYNVPNWLPEECQRECGPGCPPPPCFNCLRYEGGDVTNIRPTWWGR